MNKGDKVAAFLDGAWCECTYLRQEGKVHIVECLGWAGPLPWPAVEVKPLDAARDEGLSIQPPYDGELIPEDQRAFLRKMHTQVTGIPVDGEGK